MRNQLPVRSTQFSFPMWKCAVALLCCAFSIEPLFAQEIDWAYHGQDLNNSGFQDIDQINPSNVSQLKPAWIFHTGVSDPNMSMEMTPLVIDGVMYVTNGDDDVFALDATTGKQIWHYYPSDMPKISTLAAAVQANRGVAYGQGLIFVGRLDAALVALNAKTGALVWKTAVDTPANGAYITIAPQFIGASMGTVKEVLVGVAGGDGLAGGGESVRGHLDAYSPATGKLLWRFWTTEPHSWAGDSYLHGGAAVWGGTPSYDPVLNMVYFGTGDAFPWPWAGNRAGANLYSSSIVALDATSGELQWYFQATHHDMWDFDCAQPTMLFSWNGIPAISETSKTGYMWILDRASGQSLYAYDEAAIPPTPANAAFQHPWPTQPVSSIESLVEHQAEALPAGTLAAPMGTPVGPTPMVFQPWDTGGMDWPPAAYSPRTHMIYSHARYVPAGVGVTNDAATNAGCPTGKCTTESVAVPGVDHGVYGAVNTLTAKVAWTIPVLTTAPYSGVAVAGDLVFMGDNTGLFYAASAATGEILWVFDAMTVPNAGSATASPAIYEINGVEYVVYGFGGNPSFGLVLGDAVIAFALPSATAAAAKKPAVAAAAKARVR
jgi:quinohemoprotein ethanol dehydrogenase